MPHTDDKAQLRKRMIALRDAIPAADRTARSANLLRDLLVLPQLTQAQSIFLFISHASEVETHPMIDALLALGKTVAVPKILPRKDDPGRNMLAIPIQSRSELSPGIMGILSPPLPKTQHPTPHTRFTPDLILVPGVAFTQHTPKHTPKQITTHITRLGYGGGYYDRYLAQHPAAQTLGLCFNEQVIDELPTDPHDISLQQLLTC